MKKIIKIDSQAASYVKKMFELYSTGSYSLLSLRKKMVADGMVYRNGKNFYTSKVETILKNEFYTGIFYWNGKKMVNASHEPIITQELFQRVQEILINPRKSKSKKDMFPYTNFISCGICGCSLTAELKKGKYIYYHCTGSKGKCGQGYIRQEALEEQFELLLNQLKITPEIHEIIIETMRESLKEKIEYHDNLVTELERQIKLLQKRLDQSYLDKLDGKISEEFWQTNATKWTDEKEELSMKLLSAQRADNNYLENANFILELAKSAIQMFKSGDQTKKRRVLKTLTSNCSFMNGNLDIELKPVFGIILECGKTRKWCAR